MTMPTPLRWNAQRDWGLDLTFDEPDIILLRDHVTLISDLSRDWSSGQTGDFHHFVPNHYNFRITLLNYALHLYLNDFNLVDSPRERDANGELYIFGFLTPSFPGFRWAQAVISCRCCRYPLPSRTVRYSFLCHRSRCSA
jgi:hypothetical protein